MKSASNRNTADAQQKPGKTVHNKIQPVVVKHVIKPNQQQQLTGVPQL
jgi:hypothetical protein